LGRIGIGWACVGVSAIEPCEGGVLEAVTAPRTPQIPNPRSRYGHPEILWKIANEGDPVPVERYEGMGKSDLTGEGAELPTWLAVRPVNLSESRSGERGKAKPASSNRRRTHG
jgi:hypothetical protein